MPRTGSIGSKVGPAVIRTRLPDMQLGREGTRPVPRRSRAARASARRRLRRRPGRRCPGPRICDAVGPDLRHVALRGRVAPHLPVHRRRNQQRRFARQAQRRQQVVGQAVGQLGDEVGGGRRDHDGVDAARQLDVRHRPLSTRSSHWSVKTGLPVSAWKVVGETKCAAARSSPPAPSHRLAAGRAPVAPTCRLRRRR